jgi:hypothetical protein
LHENRTQVTQFIRSRTRAHSLRGAVCCEGRQVLAADLAGGPNAIAQLVHGGCERVERRAARLARQMRTAQLIPDPLQVCGEFCLPAHPIVLSLSSISVATHHLSSSISRPAIKSSWRKARTAIPSGRTRTHPVG